MEMENTLSEEKKKPKGFRAIHVLWIVLGTMLLTAAVTFWAVRTYVYAHDFKPVELSSKEQQQLNGKLRLLGYEPGSATPAADKGEADNQWLRPERYDESQGKRELFFSERELNGLLANNKDLAKKLAVDLSDDMVSARLLVHVDPDFPILGGKTLRVSAGVEAAFRNERPVIKLRGVSVMGVPIPNAWLGGLKNVDLIGEFGDAGGFWRSFAEGVEDIQVQDGKLKIVLKE
ncbi:hypothetical protein [Thiolapillus sp.]